MLLLSPVDLEKTKLPLVSNLARIPQAVTEFVDDTEGIYRSDCDVGLNSDGIAAEYVVVVVEVLFVSDA